jgi:RNA polymerase sigma-70 factor (ECF subfamily)
MCQHFTVADIKEGNEKAFASVYEAYKDKLYYLLLSRTKSAYLAQEVVQKTFVKVWTHRDTLTTAITIDIQIFRIARSLMIDELRKLAVEKKRMGIVEITAAEDSVNEQYHARETRHEIEKILSAVPEQGRLVFRLSREEGLTYNEIARQLSISPKTVEYHISRILSILRKSLTLILLMLTNY